MGVANTHHPSQQGENIPIFLFSPYNEGAILMQPNILSYNAALVHHHQYLSVHQVHQLQ